MGKSIHNDVLDQSLNYIKNNATRLAVCSAEPTTYTEAITTYKLADVDIDSSDFTGPSDGDVSGRKIRINAQGDVPVDSSGTATHIALVDVTNTKLLLVTTCTSQAIVASSTVDVPAFDYELPDPT